MAWKMTHEQTEVGFEVTKVEKAPKDGYVTVFAEYEDRTCTYIRKFTEHPCDETMPYYTTIIDGCEVEYNDLFEVLDVKRIYDTKGRRKKVNLGGIGTKVSDTVANTMRQNSIKIESVTSGHRYCNVCHEHVGDEDVHSFVVGNKGHKLSFGCSNSSTTVCLCTNCLNKLANLLWQYLEEEM